MAQDAGKPYLTWPVFRRSVVAAFLRSLTIERGIEREVETLERLRLIERGAPEAEVQLFLATPLDFIFDEPLQEITVG